MYFQSATPISEKKLWSELIINLYEGNGEWSIKGNFYSLALRKVIFWQINLNPGHA